MPNLPSRVRSAAVLAAVLAASAAGTARADEPRPAPIRVSELPRLARLMRQSGTVVLEALTDSTGRVRSTNVLRSMPAVDEFAAARVIALRFDPVVVEGRAVPAVHTVPVTVLPDEDDERWDEFAARRCGESLFKIDLDVRPDSTNTFTAHWTATGLKSQELFVIVMFPEGVVVDTTGSWVPQRFLDDKDAPGWPSWHRDGRVLRKGGAEGTIRFTRQGDVWWKSARVAIVALFRDVFDGTTVYRPRVFRIEEDDMGPMLVTDPTAGSCAAGPYLPGR